MNKAGLNSKIIASNKSKITQRIKVELTAILSMADIGPISFYLGLKFGQNQAK